MYLTNIQLTRNSESGDLKQAIFLRKVIRETETDFYWRAAASDHNTFDKEHRLPKDKIDTFFNNEVFSLSLEVAKSVFVEEMSKRIDKRIDEISNFNEIRKSLKHKESEWFSELCY